MAPRKAAPWQVEWKRPRWNQIGNSSGEGHSKDDKAAIVVGSASAEIDSQELPSAHASLMASQINDEPTTLLLSVTLLSRQSAKQIHQSDYPVASELLLELYECPATAQDTTDADEPDDDSTSDGSEQDEAKESVSTSKLLISKRLQWPEAIFDAAAAAQQQEQQGVETDQEAHEPKEEDNKAEAEEPKKKEGETQKSKSNRPRQNFLSRINDWLTLSPFMGKLDQTAKSEQSFLGNNPNGLLSAVLIRRPKNFENKDDAMDTIALMSLGMGYNAPPAADAKNETDTLSSRNLSKQAETLDLYLVCMTVRGLVAIYSPWTLLEESKPKSSDVQLVDSLATLFMGQEIFSALEQAWKPLSEPLTTISLSILEQNQVYKKNKRRRKQSRALDVSLWNHLVESATIPHRTVANRATKLAVAGPSYLAVFGSGIPYTQVFRHDDESSLGGDQHQSVVKDKEEDQHEQEEHPDEWWDKVHAEKRNSDEIAFLRPRIDSSGSDWLQGDDDGSVPKVQLISGPIQEWVRRDSDLEEKGKKEDDDGNNQLKKWWESIRPSPSSDDTEEDLPLTLSTGGFITFCSISQWSETRTLFLPFVPKQVSYIPEWNSMEIVLVMGETQAIAVRLDSSQAPVVIGNVTDQLQQSLVERESEDGSMGAKTPVKNENYMNIKRFQVLPIALPQSSVSSRILCGSAPGVQPPALLQLFTEEMHHGLVLQKSLKGITALGTIELSHAPSDIAKIQVGETESLSTSWSVLGQVRRASVLCSRLVSFICSTLFTGMVIAWYKRERLLYLLGGSYCGRRRRAGTSARFFSEFE